MFAVKKNRRADLIVRDCLSCNERLRVITRACSTQHATCKIYEPPLVIPLKYVGGRNKPVIISCAKKWSG